MVNGPGRIFVRQRGVTTEHPLPVDLEHLEDLAAVAGGVGTPGRQDVGPDRPLLSTDLPDGGRLQVVLAPAVPAGTASLTIRKHGVSVADLSAVNARYRTGRWNRWKPRNQRRDLSHLLALYDAGELEGFLRAAVRGRLNILLCGATGSGKTTMSKSLIGAIDANQRILTIEDTLELMLSHRNHVRLLYSKGDQGAAKVTARTLLEASLRMRPDRVLLQELRDPEAAYTYMNEVVSGHPGSITTIHGKSPDQGFKKLFTLVKASAEGGQWDDATLAAFLGGAVDLIVPFEEHGGTYEIGEVWFVADAARRGETAADLLAAA